MEKKSKKSEQVELPNNLEIEKAIIGSLITSEESQAELLGFLDADCFYNLKYKKIFEAIQSMAKSGKKIDLITLNEELKRNSMLSEVGGHAELVKLATGTLLNVGEFHARILMQKYALRKLVEFAVDTAKKAYEDDADIDDLLKDVDTETEKINNILSKGAVINDLKELVGNSIIRLKDRIDGKEKITTDTSFNSLNNLMDGGWRNGDLIVIAGRPSVGKSSIMMYNIYKLCKLKKNILLFSMEVNSKRITDKLIIMESGVDNKRYKSGRLNQDELNNIINSSYEVEQFNLTIDDRSGLQIQILQRTARQLKRKNKCDIIFIDYLQLMQIEKNRDRNEGIGNITTKLKGLANELDIPIVLLSQLSRDIEKRASHKPQLSDLRDSGSIEQDADIVIFLMPSLDYNGNKTDTIELIVAKNRDGSLGNIFLQHNDYMTSFDVGYERIEANNPF